MKQLRTRMNELDGGQGSATGSNLGPRSSRVWTNRGVRPSRTIVVARTFAFDAGFTKPTFDGMRPGGQPVRNDRARDGLVSREPIGKDAVGVGGS